MLGHYTDKNLNEKWPIRVQKLTFSFLIMFYSMDPVFLKLQSSKKCLSKKINSFSKF